MPDWLKLTDTARQTIIWIGVAIIVIWIVYGGGRASNDKKSDGEGGAQAFGKWIKSFEESKNGKS